MTIFVLALILEEVEDRENFAFWVLFEMAEDCDITPITNLFREVGRVKNELRFEEGVLLIGCQETEVELQPEIAHRLIQEACVTSFVASHVSETLRQQGVAVLDTAAQLLVKQET